MTGVTSSCCRRTNKDHSKLQMAGFWSEMSKVSLGSAEMYIIKIQFVLKISSQKHIFTRRKVKKYMSISKQKTDFPQKFSLYHNYLHNSCSTNSASIAYRSCFIFNISFEFQIFFFIINCWIPCKSNSIQVWQRPVLFNSFAPILFRSSRSILTFTVACLLSLSSSIPSTLFDRRMTSLARSRSRSLRSFSMTDRRFLPGDGVKTILTVSLYCSSLQIKTKERQEASRECRQLHVCDL